MFILFCLAKAGRSIKIVLTTIAFFSGPYLLFAQAPTIQDFSPKSGAAGTLVKLVGSNLGNASNATVYFGAGVASIAYSTGDTLAVRVPRTATYAPIQVIQNGSVASTIQPFALTFPSSNTTLSILSFQFEKKLTAGSSSRTVLLADLNKDSLNDIIISDRGSRSITIFRNLPNNGNVPFSGQVIIGVGNSNVWSAIPADINGDGWQDLVAVSEASGIMVYTNAGTSPQISFNAGQTIATGLASNRTAITADIDGDGKLDIIVAGVSNVVVLRNISTGATPAFSAPVSYTVGATPISLALADFNADGKPDIACGHQTTNTPLYVLPNLSTSGNIQLGTLVSAPVSGLLRVCVLDVDGDGKMDIATNNFNSNNISICRNTSVGGVISFAAPDNFSGTGAGVEITAADVNGDGKPDIIASSQSDRTVSVYANQSTPGNTTLQPVQKNFTTNGSYGVTAGDVDGDGRADILSVNPGSTAITEISLFSNAVGSIAEYCPGNSLSLTAPVSGSTYQWYELTDTGYAVLPASPAYSGINSQTLIAPNPPSEWSGTTLRCKVDGVFTTPVEIIILNYWTGAIDNDFLKPGNWSCGSVPDQNSNIVVRSGTLRVSTIQNVATVTVLPPGRIELAPGAQLIIKD